MALSRLHTAAPRRAVIRQGIEADPDAKLRASFERSLRRALHSLARDKMLMVLGDGGPGDPFRYFIPALNPRPTAYHGTLAYMRGTTVVESL